MKCPWPEPIKLPRIENGLFPDVLDLAPPPRTSTDVVATTNYIGSVRYIIAAYNREKNVNLATVKTVVAEAIEDYNQELVAAKARCDAALSESGEAKASN